jgi:hypothetical protein
MDVAPNVESSPIADEYAARSWFGNGLKIPGYNEGMKFPYRLVSCKSEPNKTSVEGSRVFAQGL